MPDPDLAFSFNELVVEAANTDDRISAALWVSSKTTDADRTAKALTLAAEPGVRALKVSFPLGGRATDEACAPQPDSRAMVKLNARDRAQLVVLAYAAGLVRPRWHP